MFFVTFLEALEIMEIPPEPQEQSGRSLYQRLEIMSLRGQLVRRSNDMKKLVEGSKKYLVVVQTKISAISDDKIAQLNERLEQNTKTLMVMNTNSRETANSILMFRLIFAGFISFDVLDRLTGEWTVIDTMWMTGFVENLIKGNMLVWFCISMVVWALTAVSLEKITHIMNWRSRGVSYLKIQVNRPIRHDKLLLFLENKSKTIEERNYKGEKDVVKVTYEEGDPKEWGGSVPTICLEYDEKNKYLFQVTIQYNRRNAKKNLVLDAQQLKSKVVQELDHQCIFGEDDVKSPIAMEQQRFSKIKSN